MATLKEIITMYQKLKHEWDQKPPNLDNCGELLAKLKVALTSITFLPTDEAEPSKQELLVARDILEIGTQWSILRQDIPSFQRYMAQLKPYYMDYNDYLPDSSYRYQLLGLNLLCLLTQNRLAEFHTELERLPVTDIQNNIYIKHPVSIEQYLMEGRYNKVFIGQDSVPAKSYTFFMDILLNTVRDEIAACIEKAYVELALAEATRMLFFDSQALMREYSKQRTWTLSNENYFYFNVKDQQNETGDVIPAKKLAEQAIDYALELEMIV